MKNVRHFLFFVSAILISLSAFSQVVKIVGPVNGEAFIQGPLKPNRGSQVLNKMGMHYNACEIGLFQGARINEIEFNLSGSLPNQILTDVEVRYRNNNRSRMILDEPWLDILPSTLILDCQVLVENTADGLKLRIVFLNNGYIDYKGGGLDLFIEYANAGDIDMQCEAYTSPQGVAVWGSNYFFSYGNSKPLVAFRNSSGSFYQSTGVGLPFNGLIEPCHNQIDFCPHQEICLGIDFVDTTGNYVGFYNPTELSTVSFFWEIGNANGSYDFTTTSPQLAIPPDLLHEDSIYIVSCNASGVLANSNISDFTLTIGDDLDCNDAFGSESTEDGSRITKVVLSKKNLASDVALYDQLMISQTQGADGVSNGFFNVQSRNNALGVFQTVTTTASFIQANVNYTRTDFARTIAEMPNATPEFLSNDSIKVEVTMNKRAKPMMNHRIRVRFDFDGNGSYESEKILNPTMGNPAFVIPGNINQFMEYILNGSVTATILYTGYFLVPCNVRGDKNVRFEVILKKMPTGWNEKEEYTIKTLCPTPVISYAGGDTVCVNDVLPMVASVPAGCVGTYEWCLGTTVVGTSSSFTPTVSGTYTVKFITEDCAKPSVPLTIVVLPLIHQYADADGDGFGNPLVDTLSCDTIPGYVLNNTDCNDSNVNVYPGALEICNGVDDDCDGAVDEGTAVTPSVSITSSDVDNSICQGNSVVFTASAINGGTGPTYQWKKNGINVGSNSNIYSLNTLSNGDVVTVVLTANNLCQTSSTANGNSITTNVVSNVVPSVTISSTTSSICPLTATSVTFTATPLNGGTAPLYQWKVNGLNVGGSSALNTFSTTSLNGGDVVTVELTANNVCQTTNTVASSAITMTALPVYNYYLDLDADGYGDPATPTSDCSAPSGMVLDNTDCFDADSSIFPGAVEVCNSVDEDCNGIIDDGLLNTYYTDADGDGFGAGAASNLCTNPGAGYGTNNTDCDDALSTVNPVASEICNSIDDDCDFTIDEGVLNTYYFDVDVDGFGDASSTAFACTLPAGMVLNSADCNDAALAVNPGATESCNSIDDDCDGLTDEGCALGSALLSAIEITSLPQFGLTGGNFSQNVNMASQTDSPEHGGVYPEKWFKFVAQSNAVRIAVTGASTADDNAMAIFDDPGLSYTTPLIPIDVADAVNLSSAGVTDQGNEILLTDQLIEGNTYYVVVATVNGTPGNINVKFNTLLPSSCDIAAYTGGTNTFSNVCNNFKCRYRQNAKQGILHRWASNVIAGSPLQSYTIPPSSIMNTVCQLSKFVPANISGSPQTIYVSADVQYELPDAAGVIHYLTAISTSTCSFTLNAESSINLRSTDACPNFKTTLSSLATDRSVCGTSQYQWEFTMAYPSPGLPINVSGSLGGSRILSVGSISGIANGQRYDVRIRSLHNDAVTYSGWTAVPSCFKTLGAAGMVPWSNNEEQKLTDGVTIVQLYPNPLLQGGSAQLRSSQDIDAVQIFNAAGQLIAKTESLDQMRQVDLPSPEFAGLYWIVVRSGMETHRLAWLVQ